MLHKCLSIVPFISHIDIRLLAWFCFFSEDNNQGIFGSFETCGHICRHSFVFHVKSLTPSLLTISLLNFRYLNIYEQIHFLGEDPKAVDARRDDDGPIRKKHCGPQYNVHLTYNQAQHEIAGG